MRQAAPLVLLLLAAGCLAAPRSRPLTIEPDGLEVFVQNETVSNLRILARIAGSDILLGRVDALQSQGLRLPTGATGGIRLVAEPSTDRLFGRPHVSEPFDLGPGYRAVWHLKESPGVSDVPTISTVYVYACDGLC